MGCYVYFLFQVSNAQSYFHSRKPSVVNGAHFKLFSLIFLYLVLIRQVKSKIILNACRPLNTFYFLHLFFSLKYNVDTTHTDVFFEIAFMLSINHRFKFVVSDNKYAQNNFFFKSVGHIPCFIIKCPLTTHLL